ncbi:thiolase family protein [Nocardioides terrisoli]|uniref:thiolase family protein n=1 Tax=Nocardioides terrisoli TaxID=3388267 RepID=UPI00287BB65F|nr:thiolase family protein [Nocardioides marmorisolisilvae]
MPVDQMARALGIPERPFSAQTSIAGAGVVAAPRLARTIIEAGLASVVVTYFSIALGANSGGPYAVHAEDPWKAEFELPAGWFGQPTYFAAVAARYAHEFGLPDDALAAVVGAARAHAARTPNALLREPVTSADYDRSPIVASPLRKADCCLTNDGAIAYVMTSAERARSLAKPPVVVRGAGLAAAATTQAEYFTQRSDYFSLAAGAAFGAALAESGLQRSDIDIAELYDCFSITTLLQLEELGFAERGGGPAYVLESGIGPGSPVPVNTHGGLLAQSYVVAGNHVVEAVRQLRGERGEGQVEGAEVAMVTGLGIPDYACTLLSVDR